MQALHPALALARRARLAADPRAVAPSHELWRLCAGPDRGEVYQHAVEEAGRVVRLPDEPWTPDTPCSYCGWEPPTATVAIVSYKTPELARVCRDSIGDAQWARVVAIAETGGANIGYAAALHAMFSGARTKILLACNADVEFPPDGIEPLLELFDRYPRLGVLGPRQVTPGGKIAHAGIETEGSPSGGRDFGAIDVGQCREEMLPVQQVSGSVMLIRREAYEQVGGLADMPRLYYEDALLCRRMRAKHWAVAYSGLRTFLHHVAASPSDHGTRSQYAAEGRRLWMREASSSTGEAG